MWGEIDGVQGVIAVEVYYAAEVVDGFVEGVMPCCGSDEGHDEIIWLLWLG